jgi:hypothetical protein
MAQRACYVGTPERPIHTRELEMASVLTSRVVRESSQETHHLIQDERTPLPPHRDPVHDFIHLPIPKQPLRQSPLHHPEAKGLVCSSDNFMLCLIHEPDGSNMHSYGRPVTMEQDGERIVVIHHVVTSNLVDRIGTLQRRVPSFGKEDGEEILTIRTVGQVNGRLSWRRGEGGNCEVKEGGGGMWERNG